MICNNCTTEDNEKYDSIRDPSAHQPMNQNLFSAHKFHYLIQYKQHTVMCKIRKQILQILCSYDTEATSCLHLLSLSRFVGGYQNYWPHFSDFRVKFVHPHFEVRTILEQVQEADLEINKCCFS